MTTKPRDIFVSIGTPSNKNQEEALSALIDVLSQHNLRRLSPLQTHKQPLVSVRDTLEQCDGMIVVAYPRIRVIEGVERPDSDKSQRLEDIDLTTPWNHMETAFAYDRGLPLMVLRDRALKVEGFLQYDYDWEVKDIDFTKDFMESREFSTMVMNFYNQIEDYLQGRWQRFQKIGSSDQESWTLGRLISAITSLSPQESLTLFGIIGALLSGSFYLGYKMGPLFFD